MVAKAYKRYLITLALVWGVCLAGFVAFFVLLVSPQISSVEQLQVELAEKQKTLDNALLAAKEENKKKLIDEVDALKSQLADFAVDFEDSANLTFDVSRVAGEKKVGAFAVKTPEVSKNVELTESKILQENHIDVTFESDFKQFAAFLNALERHKPVLFVDRFKLVRGDFENKTHKIDMGLSFIAKRKSEG